MNVEQQGNILKTITWWHTRPLVPFQDGSEARGCITSLDNQHQICTFHLCKWEIRQYQLKGHIQTTNDHFLHPFHINIAIQVRTLESKADQISVVFTQHLKTCRVSLKCTLCSARQCIMSCWQCWCWYSCVQGKCTSIMANDEQLPFGGFISHNCLDVHVDQATGKQPV